MAKKKDELADGFEPFEAKEPEKPEKTEKPESAGDDAGQAEVQAAMDIAHAQGFEGFAADPTPNSHYTVAGVNANKPTPETDADAAGKAAAAAGMMKFEKKK